MKWRECFSEMDEIEYAQRMERCSIEELRIREIKKVRQIFSSSLSMLSGLGACFHTGGLSLLLTALCGRRNSVAKLKLEITQTAVKKLGYEKYKPRKRDYCIPLGIFTCGACVGYGVEIGVPILIHEVAVPPGVPIHEMPVPPGVPIHEMPVPPGVPIHEMPVPPGVPIHEMAVPPGAPMAEYPTNAVTGVPYSFGNQGAELYQAATIHSSATTVNSDLMHVPPSAPTGESAILPMVEHPVDAVVGATKGFENQGAVLFQAAHASVEHAQSYVQLPEGVPSSSGGQAGYAAGVLLAPSAETAVANVASSLIADFAADKLEKKKYPSEPTLNGRR